MGWLHTVVAEDHGRLESKRVKRLITNKLPLPVVAELENTPVWTDHTDLKERTNRSYTMELPGPLANDQQAEELP